MTGLDKRRSQMWCERGMKDWEINIGGKSGAEYWCLPEPLYPSATNRSPSWLGPNVHPRASGGSNDSYHPLHSSGPWTGTEVPRTLNPILYQTRVHFKGLVCTVLYSRYLLWSYCSRTVTDGLRCMTQTVRTTVIKRYKPSVHKSKITKN